MPDATCSDDGRCPNGPRQTALPICWDHFREHTGWRECVCRCHAEARK